MSAIYNLEPQPTASAIMHTTRGELAVELFAKQTPLTCRNFLQLALDGYYDNTPFHRLVPGFILQGGDPTGTGHGGESIYDGGAFGATELDPWPMDQRRGANAGDLGLGFRDEFHSRLKFTRRGLLGMANEGRPDTNGSQFFFTLGKTDELNGKNTVFGRVAPGDTIYNLAKMGDVEVEEGGERPLYPIKITRIEILVNPFADMQKRNRIAKRQVEQAPAAGEKRGTKKRKGGKQLLSFGDDEGDGGDAPVVKKPKFDTQAVRLAGGDDRASACKEKLDKRAKAEKGPGVSKQQPPEGKRDGSRDKESMRPSPAPETQPAAPQNPDQKASSRPPTSAVKIESSPEPDQPRRKTALERTNEEIAALKASMRRTVRADAVQETRKKKSALEELIPGESMRGRKRRPGDAPVSARDEQEALSFLRTFRSKLAATPAEIPSKAPATGAGGPGLDGDKDKGENKAAVGGGAADDDAVCDLHFIANCQSCRAWDKPDARDKDEDDNDRGWMSHALSCAADKLGKDLNYRKKAEEELVVIDPLAHGRGLKEERMRGSGKGGSGRDWDRDQDFRVGGLGGRERRGREGVSGRGGGRGGGKGGGGGRE